MHIALLAAALALPTAAQAQTNLQYQRSFSTDSVLPGGADGIAFDHTSGNLILVDSSFAQAVEITTDGAFVSSLPLPAHHPEGIDVLPSGDLLVVDNSLGMLLHVAPSGSLVSSWPIELGGYANGVAYEPRSRSAFITDDGDNMVFQQQVSGVRWSADLAAMGIIEPEGVEVYGVDQRAFVVSDDLSALIELDRDGHIVDTVDLEALSGMHDSEGLALDEATATLYVSFDSDGRVGVFSIDL